jgi:hypothetical protein
MKSGVFAYLAAVGCFVTLVGIGVATGNNPDPRILYLCALFSVCASPIAFVRQLNGRYMLLCIFLSVYFLTFGASDLFDLFLPDTSVAAAVGIAKTEVAILLGAVLIVAGYRAVAEFTQKKITDTAVKDWPPYSVAIIGAIIWILGVAATWIWQIEILKRAWDPLRDLSPLTGMALTLGRMVHPLGIALLAYGFVTSRSRLFGILILCVIIGEFVLGFMEDSKEIAVQAAVIVLVAKLLIEGRVPKSWLAVAALIAVLTFPVFQAYRTHVLAERGVSRADAAMNFAKNIEVALNSNKALDKEVEYSSRSFLSRISYKPTIELIIDRAGVSAPFENGYTFIIFFEGFIPRIVWPSKPDLSIGQLFNRELRVTESRDNYISTTILGELYWNFGWLGIIVGCPLLGAFLGTVNKTCDLSQRISVTRFLIFSISVYGFCLRFEDGIAMTGTLWVRTLVVIALLHLLFARWTKGQSQSRYAVGRSAHEKRSAATTVGAIFPNLLR